MCNIFGSSYLKTESLQVQTLCKYILDPNYFSKPVSLRCILKVQLEGDLLVYIAFPVSMLCLCPNSVVFSINWKKNEKKGQTKSYLQFVHWPTSYSLTHSLSFPITLFFHFHLSAAPNHACLLVCF